MLDYKKYQQVYDLINQSEAIIIGAGSGLSAAAGITYSGKRFDTYFKDFIDCYHFTDMYSAGFYPFDSLEEYWAYWSKHIYYNRYQPAAGMPYRQLFSLIKDKNYFVITTNVDHQFQKAGFDKKRLFYTQGDYGLFQCSKACHQAIYTNKSVIMEMVKQQENLKIPSELVPYCPKCGEPMMVNLRIDQYFVEDEGWYAAQSQYRDFIETNLDKKLLFMEFGIGNNTPVIIKYPFWQMTAAAKDAHYIVFNDQIAPVPSEIQDRSIVLKGDIKETLVKINGGIS